MNKKSTFILMKLKIERSHITGAAKLQGFPHSLQDGGRLKVDVRLKALAIFPINHGLNMNFGYPSM